MFAVSLQLAGVTAERTKGQARLTSAATVASATSARYLSRAKVKDAHETRPPVGGGKRPTRPTPAGRRCLASTEIKNIDSHSHAGLHRSSIRFSPARQYLFFPRTVRGTNCSCIPSPRPPAPLTRTPAAHAAQESQTQRRSFSFGPLSPPVPRSVSQPAHPSELSSSCLRSLVRCDLFKCMET